MWIANYAMVKQIKFFFEVTIGSLLVRKIWFWNNFNFLILAVEFFEVLGVYFLRKL